MQWPIEELEKLRDNQINITGEKLLGGSTLEVQGITASQVHNKTNEYCCVFSKILL